MKITSTGMLLVSLFIMVALNIAVGSQFWKNRPATDVQSEFVYPVRSERPRDTRLKRSVEHTVSNFSSSWNSISYTFSGLDRHFILDLEPMDTLISPHFHVMTILQDANSSNAKFDTGRQFSNCIFKGQVRGDSKSFVSLSVCKGLLGLIHTCDGEYRIEPNSRRSYARTHVLYGVKNANASCARHDDGSAKTIQRKHRNRRSVSQEWNLEMLLVADSKMKHYHGDHLEMYILTLMASVALIFKDPSIGNNINISVVKLIIMEEAQDANIIFASASKTLRNFCRWQHSQNDPNDPMSSHDTAILLTREDLCRQTKTCDTLGLAQTGMICDYYSSCAVVEDNGLSAAFTIAHELGHILGIPHDDDVKCSRYREQNQRMHIMARMLDYRSHPWTWSECSRHYLTTFLDAGQANCLLNKSTKDRLTQFPYSKFPPGELYDMDYQCDLVFGQGSKICPYMPVCKRLWCTMEDNLGGCRTQHMPWADGTKCAPDKSCHHGECIFDPLGTKPPQDGSWGEWQEYGPCSRSCGGGVRRSIRECDSPRPTNGGRYCVGDRIRYESCNTEECPPGSIDFRKEQCSTFNGKTFGFEGIREDVVWDPHHTGVSKDMCKLYCRAVGTAAYFPLKEKVIDGTVCGPDTFDICVNGKCMPAGCDHELYSKLKPDACGVCGGDGDTCRIIHGSFEKVKYGYNPVVIIPAGASNIEILQFSQINMKDENYLALMDYNKSYILNGGFMISSFPKTLLYAGTTLEYSGSDKVIERINCTKQLHKNLYVQVLTVGSLHPPSVTYNYTVSIKDEVKYYWRIETNWSPCNSICQGEQYRKVFCINKTDERVISDEHCHDQVRPAHSARVCNSECYLSWVADQITQCSTTCGEGMIVYSVKCMQRMTSGITHEVLEQFCAHIEPRPPMVEPCVGSCNVTEWKYSEWSQCSVSCGGGVQHRTAKCFGNKITELPDIKCNNTVKITTKDCRTEECPQWEVSEWEECSSTCGNGIRVRQYSCKRKGEIVLNDYCNQETVPIHMSNCTLAPCYAWKIGPWEACSVSCGIGEMKRQVHCQSGSNEIVDSKKCQNIQKPSSLKICELSSCLTQVNKLPLVSERNLENMVPSFHTPGKEDSLAVRGTGSPKWKAGAWSMCSATCGMGSMRRQVVCTSSINGRIIPDQRCNFDERPGDSAVCYISFCGSWGTGKWSKCSVTCGEGIQTRTVICVKNDSSQADEKLCDPRKRPAKEQLCYTTECPDFLPNLFPNPKIIQNSVESAYYWRTGLWGKCSKPCGGGIRRRQVVCYDESGHNSTQCDLKKRPADSTSCNVDKCPYWNISSWSQCSVSCGEGVQKRDVHCMNYKSNIVPNGRCPIPVPEKERKCSMNNDCLHWSWSLWSQCSSGCGAGSQTRKPLCYRGKRQEKEENCDLKLKPSPQVKECKGHKCKYSWKKSGWTVCSTTCGEGYKYREVYCSAPHNLTVPDHFCHYRSKPRVKRRCQQHLCSLAWKTDHWSECSKTCDRGVQVRSVTCHRVNAYQWVDPVPISVPENASSLNWCDPNSKPSESRKCSLGPCKGYVWKPGSWSQCSVGCDTGRQKRRIHCQNAFGKRSANSRCEQKLRPQRRRKCYMRPCTAISCLDYQTRGNIRKDGEQEIFVHGRYIKVYCFGMNTSNPKEYITLTRGENDNYSEIYDKRLINPNSCPHHGSRYDSCPCVTDQSIGSGRTIFHRIAINISSLEVQTHDFKFSQTHVGQPTAYGESGDCYSMLSCPQGRFSLSLLGTGLIVSPLTKWITQGNYASHRIRWLEKGQVIQGKCGGYCGKCIPDPMVGLLLDVVPP